jgi:hypothetical protein
MTASLSRPGGSTQAVVVVLFALSTAGCGDALEDAARARAANDLNCPEDKVTLIEIGGTSYRAKGCGDSAVYDCAQSSGHAGSLDADYVCVPEGARRHRSDE